jgi:hypothetical protein
MAFSIEGVKDTLGGMFKGKKKWLVIGGLVLVGVFFYMRNRSSSASSTTGTLSYSGYPDVTGSVGSGSTSSGVSSDDLNTLAAEFTKQLTETSSSYADALNSQQANFNTLLAGQNSSFNDKISVLTENSAKTNAEYLSNLGLMSDANSALNSQLSALNNEFSGLKSDYNSQLSTLFNEKSVLQTQLEQQLEAFRMQANTIATKVEQQASTTYPSSSTVGTFTVVSSNGDKQDYYQPAQGQAYQASTAATLQSNYDAKYVNQTPAQAAVVQENRDKVDAYATAAKGKVWNGSAWVTKP